MFLSIPMVFSVDTSEMKTNGRSLSVLEYLQRCSYYVQVRRCVHKRIGYVQGNIYVHKRMLGLTP